MERLDLIEELHTAEKRKVLFETQLAAIESSYFIEGSIEFNMETTDWYKRGVKEEVVFNKEIMIRYIKEEILTLTERANELIEKLNSIN